MGNQCDTLCELHWEPVINFDMKIKRILIPTIVFVLLPDESVICIIAIIRAELTTSLATMGWKLDWIHCQYKGVVRREILPEVQLCRTT